MNYSILMSVYYKEKPEYFKEAIESMLNQTVKSNDFVIVCDGMLTNELYEILDKYESNPQNHIHRIQFEENQGLGIALQKGLLECKNELVARMDSDDIAIENRIELQLKEFASDMNLAICGGIIDEFDNDSNKCNKVKSVPLSDQEIKAYVKKRNPFNHMTVMMKKSVILEVGNYQAFYLNEDYYLWIRVIKNGFKCKNIDTVLVKMRTGNKMYKRRGGIRYAQADILLQKYMYSINLINKKNLISNIIIRVCIRLVPNIIRQKIYNVFLREVHN